MVDIGIELLENDNEALLNQLIKIYEQDPDPDPPYIYDDLYAELAEYAVKKKRFDLLNNVFKMGKANEHEFKVYIEYLDSLIEHSGYPAYKIRDIFYKIAVVANSNGLHNIVDHILEIFPDLRHFEKTHHQGIAGIKKIDKEILLSSDLPTLINLYNTSQSLRNITTKIFPEWLRINNPNNDFLKMSDIGFELLKNDNEGLLEQLIKIYLGNPDPNPPYTYNDLYSDLADYAVSEGRFDLLDKLFKMGKSSNENFEVFITYLNGMIVNSNYPEDEELRETFYKIAVIASNNELYHIVNHILEIFPELQSD
jgi:hypothetical protein